jgi:hypothetical protein
VDIAARSEKHNVEALSFMSKKKDVLYVNLVAVKCSGSLPTRSRWCRWAPTT